jgi:Nucleotidyl transferase AbiEii toxin, Type IV TA system
VDFARVLNTIGDFLQREGRRHGVAGAIALHAYGISRATQDLDLVTEAEARDGLVSFLESLGYETLYRSEGYSNHLHADADLGRVDVIYVTGETSRKLFEEARGGVSFGGRRFAVPRPEHLVAMKVQAIKNDPRRALRDLADVQALLRLPEIDRDEVRGYFERAGLLERYHELTRDA